VKMSEENTASKRQRLEKKIEEHKDFDPTSVGLSKGFVLTNFSKLKGCGCKVPQAKLLKLLDGIGEGIGMDSSVMPCKKFKDLFVVSTTDFFSPSVEDPYEQGRIAAANVLSDMYAMGVFDVDNVLMILAASTDMTPEDQEIVCKLMMKGFSDQCKVAETQVSGGQSIQNPWPLIGGTAKSLQKGGYHHASACGCW